MPSRDSSYIIGLEFRNITTSGVIKGVVEYTHLPKVPYVNSYISNLSHRLPENPINFQNSNSPSRHCQGTNPTCRYPP